MFPKNRLLILAPVALLAGLACDDATGGDGGDMPDTGVVADSGSVGDAGPRTDTGVDENTLPQSEKSRVKFKRQQVLARELGNALGVAPTACNEVGSFNCFVVHQITLGGVEPYELGVVEALEATASTTPIAVDRIVLNACRVRIDEDLGARSANPLIFALGLDASGAIPDLEAATVSNSLNRLYQRMLKRPAEPAEIAHLKTLYADVVTSGSNRPGRDFALLACYAVSTTMEALFY